MNHPQELHTLWATDISNAGLAVLRTLANGRFTLKLKSLPDLVGLTPAQTNDVSVFCLSLAAWKKLRQQSRSCREVIAHAPKVVVLPENCSAIDMERVSQDGFSAILKEPLSSDSVLSALTSTVESQLIFSDVVRMTKEIILDRELLSRKNHNLSFLLDFLSCTAAQTTPLEVMNTAWESLHGFMPVDSIAAILWHAPATPVAPMASHMFIPAENNTASCAAWLEILLKAEREYSPFNAVSYTQETLRGHAAAADDHHPAAGRTMVLPLKNGEHYTGALALSFNQDYDLTRDRFEVLESAMTHLNLALRNAFTLAHNRRNAELDTLTAAYNRRHFEETIEQELIRHERCRGDMAMLLVDIDHFKSINDNYGHQTGDAVLCEMVNLMHTRLRSVDYLARYGGEEFVVILPHTNLTDAIHLAERLRQSVAAHAFCSNTLKIPVTVSIGVAACGAEMRLSAQEMFYSADMAMYQAKHTGRNQVICASRQMLAKAN